MELSHETHVSEPAVLDNSHYERSLLVRIASPGPRPITGRQGGTRASPQAAALEEISGPTARVLSLALRAADRGS